MPDCDKEVVVVAPKLEEVRPIACVSWRGGEGDGSARAQGRASVSALMVGTPQVWEVVLWTFFSWRIQPLRAHTHGMWLYVRPVDPRQKSTDRLAESEVEAQVKHVMEESVLIYIWDHPALFHRGVPSTRVRNLVD
jgi:hypothetical protein